MTKAFSKFFATAVVAVVAFSMTIAPASALTNAELIELLSQFLDDDQVTLIQGLLGSTGSTQASGYVHTVTLRQGNSGSQVISLQEALNVCFNAGLVPDGSFGPATRAAVVSAQAQKGLVADGIVGPSTGSAFEMCAGTSTTTSSNDDDDDDSSDTSFEAGAGDEATFDEFEVENADDTDLKEGDEEVMIGSLEFSLEDSDALFERIDLVLEYTGGNSDDEEDPWKAFDRIYIVVDGDEVAAMDSDDDDDWTEGAYMADSDFPSDDYRFRISGIDEVLEGDEDHTIDILVDVATGVDLGTDNEAEWKLGINEESLRFLDGAGITQYLPSSEYEMTFTIEEEGGDDSVAISTSTNDPDDSIIEVENEANTGWKTVGVFEIEADEAGGDLLIDDFQVALTLTDPANVATVDDKDAGEWTDIIKDVRVTINGVAEKKNSTVTIVNDFDGSDGDTSEVEFNFEFNNDVEIDSGDEVDVEIEVQFKQQNGNYDEGVSIQASVDDDNSDDWRVEGSSSGDRLADASKTGTYTGETHELRTEGIGVEFVGSSYTKTTSDTSGIDESVTFELEFDVTAFGTDIYVDKTCTYDDDGTYATTTLSVAVDNDADDSATCVDFESDGDEKTNSFLVKDGQTERFTATVNVVADEGSAGTGTAYKARINGIGWATSDANGTDLYDLDLTDYETNAIVIYNR